jgi:NADH-quinone oxidoreductase subunit J/NAD(P)H-quinone oxidoreductase subunit 6
VLAAGAIVVEVIVVIGLKAGGRLSRQNPVDAAFGSPQQIGRLFLTDHLLAFEITSVVLLVAAVGGVILGHHSRDART